MRRGAIALGAAVVALALPASASATTRYAGPIGLTSGTCTNPAAVVPCSLDRALDVAVAGDEVLLSSGTYQRAASRYISIAITIAPRPTASQRPVLVGTQPNQDVLSTFADGAVVRDIAVRAEGDGAVALYIGGGDVGERVVAEATGAGGTALGTSGVVRDSVAHSTSGTGVAASLGGSTTTPGRLRNTTVVAENGGAGVRVRGFLGGATGYFDEHGDVRNSIVRGSPALLAVSAGPDASGAGTITFANSNVPAGSTQASGAFAQITDAGGNQTAPALLASLPGDVHQLAGSPTIDAGLADAFTGTQDLDGDARKVGAAIDIGADEYVPPPPTPPGAGTTPGPGTGAGDQTLPAGGGAAARPVLSKLALGTSRFRAAPRGAMLAAARPPAGTLVVYDANLAAPTSVVIQRVASGVRRRGRCAARRKGGPSKPRCTRFVTVGRATRDSSAGTNRFRLTGRVSSRRRLAPGAYRLVLTARPVGGPASAPITARFRIVR